MTEFNRKKLPLNALRAFETVARTGSFRSGAEALNVSQSALSRHVAILEKALGKPLLIRLARGVQLTAEGRALQTAVTESFDALDHVIEALQGREQLRLHIPPGLLASLPGSFIKTFHADNPGVMIDLTSSYGEGVNMAGLDLAIVFDAAGSKMPGRTLLWDIKVTPVCAPADAQRFAAMGLEAALASDELLHVRIPGHPATLLWTRFAAGCGLSLVRDAGAVVETIDLAVNKAASGGGLALADVEQFAAPIASGALAKPFEQSRPIGFGYYLQSDQGDSAPPEVRRLKAALIRHFDRGR